MSKAEICHRFPPPAQVPTLEILQGTLLLCPQARHRLRSSSHAYMDNSVVSYGHDFSKGFLRFRNVRVGRTAIIEPLAQILPGASVPDGCRFKSKSLVLPLTGIADCVVLSRWVPRES